MRTRLQLRDILQEATGLTNLYFQPPSSVQMKYPCLVYGLSSYRLENSDNRPYIGHKNYSVTIIDKNPDSEYPDKMLDVPYIRFDRHFSTDNLHHWVYTLYF